MPSTPARNLPVLKIGNETSYEVWWVHPEFPGENYLVGSWDNKDEAVDFVSDRPDYHVFKTTITRKEITRS